MGLDRKDRPGVRAKAIVAVVLIPFVSSVAFGAIDEARAASIVEMASQDRSVAAAPDDGRIVVALSFFERLFNRKSRDKSKEKEKDSNASKTRKPAAPRVPVIQTVKKDPDAAVIAVFGDEFSMDLAWGLKDAFAKTPDVRVDIHSVANSGLIYRASRNPLEDPEKVFEKSPYTFAVVMVGLGDRVKTREVRNKEGDVVFPSYEFKSEGWLRSYEREIDRLRLAFAEHDKPLFWVGLPPVGNKDLSANLLYLNDFVSSKLTERGETFIDIWPAFSNEEGGFTFRGPDLTGQEKRLRQKNAIRFNKAGRRKLAFFVEKLVIRALSQSVAEDVLPENLTAADETALKEGRGAQRDIFVLRKPPLDADALVNPDVATVSSAMPATEAQQVISPGRVPQLRVDDFSWSGR
ncbi:hypothetical protein SAMN04515647_1803 [Cohaesibacter sp. ES.047]|uniref:SGNH/GDSL hydrolase family protein n=1 Tax=Cohaesibacter sp. ES.047 TaxID=1798205 RepID=UPI000BC0BD17|nr:DUF459 domain-containing protein [Cohaesibacter sp. ES.047]SNY91575.1 hypothetical protein SAMN04515647_1803 [Cohaesibacter sp. ES.047]